jgi:hypothetical protein
MNFLTDAKVSNETFVQLFGSNASGVIAFCRGSHSKRAWKRRGGTTKILMGRRRISLATRADKAVSCECRNIRNLGALCPRLGRLHAHTAIHPSVFVETVANQASTKVSINTFVSYCVRRHCCANDISSCVPEHTDYGVAVFAGHFDTGTISAP